MVWDDSVAPETCIDFDVPDVDYTQVLASMSVAALTLTMVFGLVVLSDPVGSNPVALRSTVIPYNGLRREQGYDVDDEEE